MTTYGRDLQYAVIGRLKREHDAYGLDADQIGQIIATELIGYVNESDIIHVPPNYIICLDSPFAQEAILSEPTMHTNHFQLEMVPWSKEHEWAQLPWISVGPTEGSKLVIDPLQILPVVPKNKRNQGIQRLKDNFAATIPRGYDVRAPDFSYLMICELRSFYRNKFHAFIQSKEIAIQIRSIISDFIPKAANNLPHIAAQIQPVEMTSNTGLIHGGHIFLTDLSRAVKSTDVDLERLLNLANTVLDQADIPLNLESFTEGPSTLEIAVPLSYADRLKVIYTTAIKKIHSTTPIIETIKAAENRYETYVTVDNFTRRYFGSHTKNGPAMEAAAIFYALKRLTNAQGYHIMDLNYPILHRLVSDIDDWNKRINIFQLFGDFGLTEIGKRYTAVSQNCEREHICKLEVRNKQAFIQAIEKLEETFDHLYTAMTDLCQSLYASKQTYHNIRVGIYSPTTSVYRWGRSDRPLTASNTAESNP